MSLLFLEINHLNAELNPIRHLLALLEAHPILHVSGIRVNIFEHCYEIKPCKLYQRYIFF